MSLGDNWTPIKTIYDLPEDPEYFCHGGDEVSCWEDIFKHDKDDDLFDSEIALFMLEDEEERCFPAIGRVEFFKDADITTKPGFMANYVFYGVAIAPSDYTTGDDNCYLSGTIYAKPIAWMPIDYSPMYW